MKRTSLDNIILLFKGVFIFIIQYTQKEKILGGKKKWQKFQV